MHRRGCGWGGDLGRMETFKLKSVSNTMKYNRMKHNGTQWNTIQWNTMEHNEHNTRNGRNGQEMGALSFGVHPALDDYKALYASRELFEQVRCVQPFLPWMLMRSLCLEKLPNTQQASNFRYVQHFLPWTAQLPLSLCTFTFSCVEQFSFTSCAMYSEELFRFCILKNSSDFVFSRIFCILKNLNSSIQLFQLSPW